MAFNAFALLPEVTIAVPNVNDDAEHVLFIQQADDAWSGGQDPLDFWVPQVELGFPQFLYYQNLPHLVVVALGRLTFGLLSLRTLFDLVRYLLLVGFPLTVFWSMRRVGFSDVAAAIGAAAGSLLSGSHRYGFEYDSYVWRGLGVYTQIFGMHLAFLALATLHRVATRGTGVIAAALVCAALALSHLIYAYMTAITAVVLLLFGLTRANAFGRIGRFAAVGALGGVMAAFMWVPFFAQAGYLNASPYLEPWKYDSFGAPTILGWLASGDLLDHGRLPVLTALLAVGIVAAVVIRTRVLVLTLLLFVLWLVLYFGRPTLGPIADLLPLHDGLLFHRFVGGVDVFAILLIGGGGAYLWDLARAQLSPRRALAATAATVIALAPALAERWSYYADNASWMRTTQAALDADTDAKTVLDALAAEPSGRVYAGLRNNWGHSLGFGIPFESIRLYNLLVFDRLDAVAPPYRGASLNSDLLFDFNDQDPAAYRLFDVEYVIAPPSVTLARGLVPIVSTPRYVLYRAPGGGYAEYAAVARSETPSSQFDLFERARAWLRGGSATSWQFARYEYRQPRPLDVPVPIADCARPGISYERAQPSRYDVLASCATDSAMVLKVTYHPNWRVTVDGREVATFMVSPSYLAFALPAGQHFITAEYRSAPLKDPLFGVGALVFVMCAAYVWRAPARVWIGALGVRHQRVAAIEALGRGWRWMQDRPMRAALVLGVLSLAVIWPFTPAIAFNNGLGNDGLVYGAMVRELREHLGITPAPPWVFRLFPVWLVSITPLDVRTGFFVLNLVSVAASLPLLIRFLARYAVTGGVAVLAVGWWLLLPMGLRWDLYYPVLPDALGFLLLMLLLVSALEKRYLVFAVALVAAALTRENLLMMVPFIWLANLRGGWRAATLLTAAASAPAIAVFFLVRVFPPITPFDAYPNWLASHRIDVNIQRITQNIDGHAWRYLLAAPLSLGLLVAIPIARSWRDLGPTWQRALVTLRAQAHWAYFVLATFALAVIGGWDDDRYLFVLAPPALVLTFGLARELWSSPWRAAALTVIQLVAIRFLWPVGPSEHDYFQYTVAFMDQSRMWGAAVIAAIAFGLAVVVARLDPRALSPARGAKAESSA
jgi:hypothetical protein